MYKGLLLSAGALSAYWLSEKRKTECCGIIGILSESRQNISGSLSIGIELLKNRGYDSAGIVTFHKEEDKIGHNLLKHAEEGAEEINCIERLVRDVSSQIVKAHVGIGHTRWATCGEKVTRNAHPHFNSDQSIYIVHNGIIGGYLEIIKKHLSDVQFTSETDSEVIAQLLSKFRKQGLSMVQSIMRVQEIMKKNTDKPQWGVVIMDKNEPDKLWTTTNGSPILVGFNQTEIFVASEPIAFIKEADAYFVTRDGEILELETKMIPKLRQKMIDEERLHQISHDAKGQVMKNPPEPFKRFYSYELRQQGEIEFKPECERVKSIYFGPFCTFVACGSSFYAAQAAEYFYKKLKTFKKIHISDPVELTHEDILDHETVVVISQSGETKDLSMMVEDCKKIQGVKTIGIINVEGSTIARKVDYPIYLKVGREVSVAATKSMFHQAMNLIMLATLIAEKKQSAPKQLINEIREELSILPSMVKKTIAHVEEDCEALAKVLYKKESIYLLAKRESLAIAKEAALKIKELNYIHAEALGASEMKHGPIALIDSDKPKSTTVILFVLDNETYEPLMNAVDQMRSRNAQVIIVTDCKEKILHHYDTKDKEKQQSMKNIDLKLERDYIFLTIPKMKHCSHLLSLIPMQILVEQISYLKEINPDMPRNLAKTVTV